MGHFRSDLRDLEFDLFEVFRVQDGPTAGDVDTDPDTLRGVLRELNALATGPLAQGFAEADRHPPTFDPATHAVTVPDAVKSSTSLSVRQISFSRSRHCPYARLKSGLRWWTCGSARTASTCGGTGVGPGVSR